MSCLQVILALIFPPLAVIDHGCGSMMGILPLPADASFPVMRGHFRGAWSDCGVGDIK